MKNLKSSSTPLCSTGVGKFVVLCDYGWDGYGFLGPYDSMADAKEAMATTRNAVAILAVKAQRKHIICADAD